MMTVPFINGTSSPLLTSQNPFTDKSFVSRELLSNQRPSMEEQDPWHENLHLHRLSDSLIISGITSPPLYNCLNHAPTELSYEEHAMYSRQCLESYYMSGANVNTSTFILSDATQGEGVLKENPQLDFPEELTHINLTNLIAYSILFPLAAVGNLLVLVALFRSRHRKSRVNLMILHLSLADMIVTFIFLPMEITWQVTIQWEFGKFGCKLHKFFSAFGFYTSSMVLVCISLDRYFAVLHPLKVNDAQRRGKIMLFFAWVISAFISLPQSIVFTVESHPQRPSFQQCVSFAFFDGLPQALMVYTVFCICFLYFLPLTIILVAYTRIIVEISNKSKETQCEQTSTPSSRHTPHHLSSSQYQQQQPQQYRARLPLRRSNMTSIERARTRTLRMTFIIVMAFICCWTPYALGTLWNFIDSVSFMSMNKHVQDVLFILAVSNSVVNPFIYGRYSIPCCRNFLQGNSASRLALQRRQQHKMRLEQLQLQHMASTAGREMPSRAEGLGSAADPSNTPRLDQDSIAPTLNPLTPKGGLLEGPANDGLGAAGVYEDHGGPTNGEGDGEAIGSEEGCSGDGPSGLEVGAQVEDEKKRWSYDCWCCCRGRVRRGRVGRSCRTTGFCNGSPPVTRSTATLYTHNTRERMVVKLLTFLHDLNRPMPPSSMLPSPVRHNVEMEGMIPLSVLEPLKSQDSHQTALLSMHSHPHTDLVCSNDRKRCGLPSSPSFHRLTTLQQLRSCKSGRNYKFQSKAKSHHPSMFYKHSGADRLTVPAAPAYQMPQIRHTLRYSQARISSGLKQISVIHKSRGAEPVAFKNVDPPAAAGGEMVLHINDYSFHEKGGCRIGVELECSSIIDDHDSYDESSGYSSGHAHIKSCQNVAGKLGLGLEEFAVWEHHNSC